MFIEKSIVSLYVHVCVCLCGKYNTQRLHVHVAVINKEMYHLLSFHIYFKFIWLLLYPKANYKTKELSKIILSIKYYLIAFYIWGFWIHVGSTTTAVYFLALIPKQWIAYMHMYIHMTFETFFLSPAIVYHYICLMF